MEETLEDNVPLEFKYTERDHKSMCRLDICAIYSHYIRPLQINALFAQIKYIVPYPVMSLSF